MHLSLAELSRATRHWLLTGKGALDTETLRRFVVRAGRLKDAVHAERLFALACPLAKRGAASSVAALVGLAESAVKRVVAAGHLDLDVEIVRVVVLLAAGERPLVPLHNRHAVAVAQLEI